MKKFILLFIVFGMCLAASASIVEKGKTWWYYDTQYYYEPAHVEYGLTIGDKSDYDDGSWSEVVFEKAYYYCDRYSAEGGANYASAKEEKIKGVVALVKEEDGVFYTKRVEDNLVGDGTSAQTIYSLGRVGTNVLINLDEDNTALPVSSIYAFGNVGDKFKFGNEYTSCDMQITAITTEDYPDGTYNVYTADALGEPTYDNSPWFHNKKITYTREFGVTDYGLGSYAFYAPVSAVMADGRFQGPKLRYVTDPDKNIIYTLKGGPKIWEPNFDAGVTDIIVDNVRDAQPEYYNLQGVRIDKPAAGQVVIKRQGAKTAKVVIR